MLEQLVDNRASQPTCVWMDAGLITYKLCDRNYECEHCPLDAALHGASRPCATGPAAIHNGKHHRMGFPEDRVYCRGHTWLRSLDAGGIVRFGIDSFAASLMPAPEGFRALSRLGVIQQGHPLCEIVTQHGQLSLAAPIDARVTRWNGALTEDPEILVRAPYDDGWIVDLRPADLDDLRGFESRAAATESARLDFRRFLRRVGQELLLEVAPSEAMVSNGQMGTDLRQIIGGLRFLHLLRESIH